MEIRQLRAFTEVVRTGTFRAAASALHLTQPALWQQVRALQDELGVALFERAGRRVRLTSVGAQVLEHARTVLAAGDRLVELAAAVRAGNEGVIANATPAPAVERVLAKVVGELSRAHPHVRIAFHDATLLGKPPLEALASGEVDLAVGGRDSAYEGIKLYRVDVRLVVAPRHPWAKAKQIHVRRLAGVPLISAAPGSLSRGLLARACANAGFEPDIRFASSSPGMLVALARAGYGVGVLASDALAGVDPRPAPALVDDTRSLATETWLNWRPHSQLSPATEVFIDLVREVVA
jgi:DNA-binding transcriptional LysR family regulator